jgi:hypothetical protein
MTNFWRDEIKLGLTGQGFGGMLAGTLGNKTWVQSPSKVDKSAAGPIKRTGTSCSKSSEAQGSLGL